MGHISQKIGTANGFFFFIYKKKIKWSQLASGVLNIVTIHLNNEVKINWKKTKWKKKKPSYHLYDFIHGKMNKSDILRVQLRKQSKLPVHRWPMIEVHLILYLWKHKLIHNTHTLYPHKNIYSETHIHTQQNQQLFKLYSKMLHSLWSTDHGILFLISHITNLEAQVNSALCNLPSCICGIFLLKNKRGVERSEGTPSLHQFSRSVMSNSLRPHGPQHARLPVHHQLLESTQIHVHWVGNAIQSSHPLSSPSPPAFNLSQHQGLFQWVSSSHQVSKVLEFQLQHPSSEHSGLISFRMD